MRVEGGKEVMGIWRRWICKIVLNFNHFSHIYLVLYSWNRICSTGMRIGIKWAGMYSSSSFSAVVDSSLFIDLHRCTRQVNCPSVGGIPQVWQTNVDQCPAITRAAPPVVFFPQLTVCFNTLINKIGRHVQWSVVLSCYGWYRPFTWQMFITFSSHTLWWGRNVMRPVYENR